MGSLKQLSKIMKLTKIT